jgi:hypothetical protein
MNLSGLTRLERRDLMDELHQESLDNAEAAALHAYYDMFEEKMKREYASCLEDDYDAAMDDYDLADDLDDAPCDLSGLLDLYDAYREI